MKKNLTSLLILLIFANTFSQQKDDMQPKLVGDTLITKSGFKIIIGQDINLGTGSTPDGDFKFIRRNSTGFGTIMMMTDNNSYNKSQLSLPRNMAGHKGKVVKIVVRGNQRIGQTFEPLITFGSGRYEIDVDNAIAAGEIIVPEQFKPKPKAAIVELKQNISIADEIVKLKRLLDDGILTKEEYDIQKKKLLESN
ncbi:SHOCT domain-containing protein [Chryseobacterium sp. PET-29]|uniref:SHOCT domain-containing protein n=1 Tax=Chryseobacterium sp. PET-29 TaxID=2983267 RepID=UPI0021E61191|nr:SHOCT domain-containing protein [Chryseobacterium sp. PET-29]